MSDGLFFACTAKARALQYRGNLSSRQGSCPWLRPLLANQSRCVLLAWLRNPLQRRRTMFAWNARRFGREPGRAARKRPGFLNQSQLGHPPAARGPLGHSETRIGHTAGQAHAKPYPVTGICAPRAAAALLLHDESLGSLGRPGEEGVPAVPAPPRRGPRWPLTGRGNANTRPHGKRRERGRAGPDWLAR